MQLMNGSTIEMVQHSGCLDITTGVSDFQAVLPMLSPCCTAKLIVTSSNLLLSTCTSLIHVPLRSPQYSKSSVPGGGGVLSQSGMVAEVTW
jgi:hypothetical protein